MPEENSNSQETQNQEEAGNEGIQDAEPLEEEEAPEPQEQGGTGFLSPAGVLMFLTAGIIDLIGLIILLFGLDDFAILDVIGLVFIGGLMFISSGSMTETKGSKNIKNKILKRLGLSFLVEIVPVLGSLSPSWTIAVFLHLKNQQ